MFSRPQLAATLLLAALALPLASAHHAAPDDWTLNRADGTPFALSDNAGEKPTVVLFWATWCPYCKALMPHIESMLLEHGTDAFEVAAVTLGEDGDPAMFLHKQGYDFTLLPDGEDVAKRYGIRGTPGVLIFSRDGHAVFDLRDAPAQTLDTGNLTRREVAARRAPHWAAQIRKALDEALDTTTPAGSD